jgi:hypothetical protein
MNLPSEAILEWLAKVRARLDGFVAPLREQFPAVQINSFAGAVGDLTEFQAQQVGLEAQLPSAHSVALTITAAYLTTTPRVLGDVGWDADTGGGTEASTSEEWGTSTEWPIASADNLMKVEEDLQRLVDAFRGAIVRGRSRQHS